MQMLGDIFVILPGGYGTLDEFTTSFSYLNFTRAKRPMIIYNADGIFDPLLAQLNLMADNALMPRENLDILTVVYNTEDLVKALDAAAENI